MQTSFAQDAYMLKVHFLYGSKPNKKYKTTEKKWFGGMLGGHAGIEVVDGKILHFLPKGTFHYIASKQPHSKYVYNTYRDFYEILGGKLENNKRLIVYIPITAQQKIRFDSLVTAYTNQPPYDYAFAGFRCGSATYQGLAMLDILPHLGNGATKLRIFYPRLLRKKILKLANKNKWKMEVQPGSISRKWEKDK
jgi:hypothetical protein